MRIENVVRAVDGITYLDNVHFYIFKGEILGLIPLDNHGKEELIELIVQNVPIDFGSVYFAGQLVNSYEHSSMARNPVYVIEKESKLVGDLKVADNIALSTGSYRKFIVSERALVAETRRLFQELGICVDSARYASELNSFETAVVELIRAVESGSQLIILDDLSTLFSAEELAALHRLLKHYSEQGISFLYISGNLQELCGACQRLVLFEKGQIRRVVRQKDFSPDLLGPYRVLFTSTPQPAGPSQGDPLELFRCRELRTAHLAGLSFSVKAGECLAILDPNKAGIQDLAGVLSGALRPVSGMFVVAGRSLSLPSKQNLLLSGIAYIPEDPVPRCLFYDHSYLENLTFLLDRKLGRSIIRPQVLEFVRNKYKEVVGSAIDAPDLWSLDMDALYSLVYLRILLFRPQVVFIAQPFAHADMHLSALIADLINLLKQNGLAAVLLVSSPADTQAAADRVLTLDGNGRPSPPPNETITQIP